MARHVYEHESRDGRRHQVATDHNHDDHPADTFQRHLLDVLKSASGGVMFRSHAVGRLAHSVMMALCATASALFTDVAIADDAPLTPAQSRQILLDEIIIMAPRELAERENYAFSTGRSASKPTWSKDTGRARSQK